MKMRLRITSLYSLAVLAVLLGFQACKEVEQQKKRIVYVNSYHRGFPPSDEITSGVFEFFWADSYEVVDYFMDTYISGRTPSPCLVCNRLIKFGELWQRARTHGATRIATGHYARRYTSEDGIHHLLRGKDDEKDQSYFLARITQEQLGVALFPLGEMRKQDVQVLASEKRRAV